MNLRPLCTLVAGVVLASASLTFAQAQPQPGGTNPPAGGTTNGGNNNGGNRGRGNFDPAQFRAQMEARMKEQLGVNDDEWKVLQPKLEKVNTARNETRGGGFGGFGRNRGGNNGGGNNGGTSDQPQSAVSKASSELRATLEKKDAPADEINAKLAALREARAKAKADLEAAQKELKEVLTARQEAVLVSMGTLE
jgi:hypothetical protein